MEQGYGPRMAGPVQKNWSLGMIDQDISWADDTLPSSHGHLD